MSRSKSFFTSLLSAFFAAFFLAGGVYAATTISTDITTGGLLTVSGLSALNGQASTTQLSVFNRLYVGGSATTTILGDTGVSSFSGNITVPAAYSLDVATAGALNIGTTTATSITIGRTGIVGTFPGGVSATGASTLGQTQMSVASTTGDFSVGGNATTTAASGNIATVGTLTLANSSTAIGGIVFGVCGWGGNVTIAASSSSAYFDCTNATGVTTSHRVFVEATSTLSSSIIVQSASSTAAGRINVQLVNTSQVPVTLTQFSLNFFGIR